MGKRRGRQRAKWALTSSLIKSPGQPFCEPLRLLKDQGLDAFLELACVRASYFRLLAIGYFEGIEPEHVVAPRVDGFTLPEFVGFEPGVSDPRTAPPNSYTPGVSTAYQVARGLHPGSL